MTTADSASTDAIQAALAVEHSAIYILGALGGRTSASSAPALASALEAAYEDHVNAREALAIRVVAAGLEPVASSAVYDLPRRIGSAESIGAAALRLEQDTTATYLSLAPKATGTDRILLVQLLCRAAARQLDLGAKPTAFPGT
ncbi:DUF4439 domain-containing protein [Nocardioides albus]|uniref:DUF4439 domain-containing protein n=1 Tax=Nocardioides albus TaxID=1841 RepID=A0A7W5A9U2_9ACTN|nr:DUF4439 domain-containing protein [Nocardioides albus]MBB3092268.1 hypothetical protein [Nocardioides albus]GGU11646.1 hypothetical protein GCM10007979_06900 [Nocardioides albus]